MAGLSHLRDVYEKRGKDFLENLLNKSVIINENIGGAYFGAKKDADTNTFNYFKKDSKLGYVDRVLSKYYESAIQAFQSIPHPIVVGIPEKLVFGMQYSPEKKKPLTLTHIKVLDENYQTTKIVHTKDILEKWADHLKLNRPGIIFQGKLSDDQKTKIQEFLFTPLTELSERFKTQSFTKHILAVLNPTLDESVKIDFENRGFDEVVFRFYDEDAGDEGTTELAKIVDPVFFDRAKTVPKAKVQKKSDDYIWIIVIDLMNFIESFRISELRSFTIGGENRDERYISLINQLFRDFIKDYGDKYADLDIQVPEFLTLPEFDVNLNLIGDGRVAEIINSNPNFKEIYRIFVNIFRKKKLKIASSLFTDEMRLNLLQQIEKLEKVCIGDTVYENYFPSFNEFVGDESEPGYFETYDRQPDEKPKVQRVNLIVSEFQPAHNGHVKSARLLKEKNGLPTLLVSVHPGKTSKVFPFKPETVSSILSKITNGDSETFAGNRQANSSNIESILSAVKPDFEPVIIAAEPSRVRDLALQLELAKKRSRNLNIRRDCKLIEIPSSGVEELILTSIKNKDFSAFKESTPTHMHSEFYNLNRDLSESIAESVQINESSLGVFDKKYDLSGPEFIKPANYGKIEAIIEIE